MNGGPATQEQNVSLAAQINIKGNGECDRFYRSCPWLQVLTGGLDVDRAPTVISIPARRCVMCTQVVSTRA